MSVKIRQNLRFNKRLAKGFQVAVQSYAYAVQARKEITSIKWEHPRDTVRSNGQKVGSPRDIVDSGKLRDSQQPPKFSQGGTTASIEWTAEYALYVHEGVTYQNGTSTPPKRWTESALAMVNDNGDIQDAFNEALR